MEIRRIKVDASQEKMILTYMIVSDPFLTNIIPIYKKEYWNGSSAEIVAKWCIDYYKQYEKAPGKHIQDIFEREVREGKLDEPTEKYIERILSGLSDQYENTAEELNVDYLLDEAKKLFKEKELQSLISNISKGLDIKNIDYAYSKIYEFIAEVNAGMSSSLQGHTANELLSMDLPDKVFHIENLLAIGGGILAGPPKIGKSWLALLLALITLIGGIFLGQPAQQGGVVYLALEDSFSRIKKRLMYMMVALNDIPALDNLHIFTQWPRVGAGGIEALEDILQKHNGIKLIVVDTLEKIRPTRKTGGNPYGEDYAAISYLKSIGDKYGIAVLILHHLRKADAQDYIDRVSGTTGLTGSVDTILILTRSRGDTKGKLWITGRDVEEQNLSIEFCPDNGHWKLLGEADEWDTTPERREIIEVMREKDRPMMLKEIAEALDKSVSNVAQLLSKLEKTGIVIKKGYGQYVLNTYKTNKSNKSDSSENNMNEGFGLNTKKNNKTNKSSTEDTTGNNESMRSRVLHRVMERSMKEEFEDV
ncbi:MAG: hypothetical protein A2W05_01060 [Candidatus Schekmanbacteria bacterium RBG_16_38_10]|uniref:Uncharacterized protein n=1 Tax=Candidatus Schekmanbacteria bacterium RBG_16_38_10 TaxID=1817879 RepID=A0A1F7S0V4_9BACT|nr:MAG: hypothetical protein A2W05_01060 [Candidatus Schekmanbacteria bacterium RBG_16_38_10]